MNLRLDQAVIDRSWLELRKITRSRWRAGGDIVRGGVPTIMSAMPPRRFSSTHHVIAGVVALWLLVSCGPSPDSPEDARARVQALIARADPAAASELLADAIERWPDDARLRELQGDIDLEAGRGELAEAAYQRAARLAPDDRRLAIKLARSLLAQKRYLEAHERAADIPTDPAGIRAGFALVRLEARLNLPGTGFLELRLAAEALWRGIPADSVDTEMGAVAARLADIARLHDPVEAGRQHARCGTAGDAGTLPVNTGAAGARESCT